MPFLLDGNPTQSEISDAINYLLSNFSGSVSSDPNTGVIVGSNGEIIGYLYRFLAIKYADSFDGSVNFSDVPTNRLYYGKRNNNDAAESSNPADYIWTKVTGGFGTTKFLWYQTTGGRAIQFSVSTSAPDTGWVKDSGASIDLDVITSANVPVIAESFVTYFTPPVMQVPRTGSPLAPVFTNVKAVLFATDLGVVIPYSGATVDTSVDFVNNSWRIGNSSTTGFGDISYTNITVGNPTDGGDYAIWPDPTAMSSSPAFITVPVRYKNSLGVVTQASVAKVQFTFADPGATGPAGSSLDISGYTSFVQNSGGAYTPTNATLSAVLSNVTSPTYAWTISGATPTSASTASVVVTPTSSSTGVDVTLTVNGSNLLSPISKTIKMPVVYDGAPGQAGSNGVMSAFPTIYIWTGSSTPPTRPTTTSTYTWATGAYTAPSGWSTSAPSNTTPGNYLWSITVPLNELATVTTSTLDWTNTANPIRGIAYNGTNGSSASVLTLSSTAQTFAYDGAGAAFPTSQTITFTANLQGLVGSPVFTATKYNAAGTNIGSPSLGGSGLSRTLAIADFNPAEYCVVTANLSGYSDTITVIRVADGTNATVGLLTNESVTVAADSSGNVISFANAGGTFKMFYGATDVTTSSAFSVVSSSGVTISINSSTGVYSVSAMSALNGTATLQAVYNGVTIQKIYSISKSLAGPNGSPGSATFVVDRGAGSSSAAPTDAEVFAVISRNPVAGDICTVSYNNNSNATVWRYVTSWITQTTYITGSLIVQNTITADKISSSTILTQALRVGDPNNLPVRTGTTMTGAGSFLYADGTFAMGNASKNVVFDGSQLYMNGFANATTSSSNGVYLTSTPQTILTFTISKQVPTILGSSGYFIATLTTPSFAPTHASIYLTFSIFNSSGVQVSGDVGFQVEFDGPVVYDNANSGYYFIEIPYSFSRINNLPTGTYTVRADGSGYFGNSNNSSVSSPSNMLATYRAFVYQASI